MKSWGKFGGSQVYVRNLIETLARANLSQLGLAKWVRMIKEASTDEIVLSALPEKVGLVFLDSYHDYENTMKELVIYGPHLQDQSFIDFHDSIYWPGVPKAIKEYSDRAPVLTIGTSKGNGVSIIGPYDSVRSWIV